eukprot:SAG22_NODE_49_length_24620_cov_80.053587_17_plen_86_part_00
MSNLGKLRAASETPYHASSYLGGPGKTVVRHLSPAVRLYSARALPFGQCLRRAPGDPQGLTKTASSAAMASKSRCWRPGDAAAAW